MFWFLASLLAAIVSGALFATLRGSSEEQSVSQNPQLQTGEKDHFAKQLAEIERDETMERISADQAEAARAELAREVIKAEEKSAQDEPEPSKQISTQAIAAGAIVATLIMTFGLYVFLGRPDLPTQALSSRTDLQGQELTVEEAVAQIEQRLQATPDDVRGWQAVGPIYMRMGRFEDALNAFEQVNALSAPTSDSLTDEAEARLMLAEGEADGLTMDLLSQAFEMDASHVRSLYYLAGQSTQNQQWDMAEQYWTVLLDLSQGNEPWVPIAQQGLDLAQGRGVPSQEFAQQQNDASSVDSLSPEQQEMVQTMVSGLAERLYAEGGSAEEWFRLVRSRLVLGDPTQAQIDYERAVAEYPNQADRAELDALAAQNGFQLTTSESE